MKAVRDMSKDEIDALTTDEVKQMTKQHYYQMRDYASLQKLTDMPGAYTMLRSIHQWWYEKDCPYCQKYFVKAVGSDYREKCRYCPLYVNPVDGEDTFNCCGGLWKKMENSATWQEFLVHSESILVFIDQI